MKISHQQAGRLAYFISFNICCNELQIPFHMEISIMQNFCDMHSTQQTNLYTYVRVQKWPLIWDELILNENLISGIDIMQIRRATTTTTTLYIYMTNGQRCKVFQFGKSC
ncbi:putative coiled-coil domain-containing protein 52 [Trichinella spiralis]|uniref:putative coiled-coil domain-containing protein 52 n=1 Tax=Trichinella spiralis TaxID=6334 RepID=UPI0001EFDF47|nr:putative coiled-coil domain-containing protein 52 [Trichinella spiralis]